MARVLPIAYKYISFLCDAKSHMYKHAAQDLWNETTFSAAYLPATSFMNGKMVPPRKQPRPPKYFHVLHQTSKRTEEEVIFHASFLNNFSVFLEPLSTNATDFFWKPVSSWEEWKSEKTDKMFCTSLFVIKCISDPYHFVLAQAKTEMYHYAHTHAHRWKS